MTAFGVGLDFGVDLAKSISEVRGGNYVYLADAAAIERVVNQDLEFILTPVAYDFELKAMSGDRYDLVNTFGVPDDGSGEFSMSAATLFLSRNKGAFALEFAGKGGGTIATVQLSYVRASDGQSVILPVEVNTNLLVNEDNGLRYSHEGVKKIVALTGMVIGIRRSVGYFLGDSLAQATAVLDSAALGIDRTAAELSDTTLLAESALVRKLRDNMIAKSATKSDTVAVLP
jgi:Ca-activated chloride channel family protein